MTRYLLAASAILVAPAALAQTPPHDMSNMPGMTMPAAKPAPKPAQKAKPKPKPATATAAPAPAAEPASPPAEPAPVVAAPAQAPPPAHDMANMPGMDHSKMDHGAMTADAAPQMDHAHMDHAAMAGMQMTGDFGAYPMTRDASGTSWQPDAASHAGVHIMSGDWMVMGHALLNGVYSSQGGLRGDDKAFVSGMAMLMARRSFGNGDSLNFRAMVSPDPFMGKSGYPLLLASGETADGTTHLIDRQHPHDLFMELSASFTKRLSDTDSVFVYAGLPGEPAFGPPAFMHRPAAADSPEAPITHHWLDSTHITYGVATLGWVHDGFKLEASRFRGREPDQDRYDIETGELDSTAVRLSWNPTANWSLQASWADVISPEQLEPDLNQKRLSASALYTRSYAGIGEISATLAFGRKERSDGVDLDAWLGEASWRPDGAWTVFSRGEAIESDELGLAHVINKVSKLSLGVIHDWRIADHMKFGIGALVARNFVGDALDPLYGGDQWGGMGFVRLKID